MSDAQEQKRILYLVHFPISLEETIKNICKRNNVTFTKRAPSPTNIPDNTLELLLIIMNSKPTPRHEYLTKGYLGFTYSELMRSRKPGLMNIMFFMFEQDQITAELVCKVNNISPNECTVCIDEEDLHLKVVNFVKTFH